MKITDRIYGEFDITEPVLVELIKSKPVQRLKEINQYGTSPLITPGNTVTRYEHSVGVMLLLRKLGASVEEQVAGLLHDVSHTAYSHVADFLFRNESQTYHEDIFESVVLRSEIPAILKTYGIALSSLQDHSKHTLLEQDAPDLCADRVDYALRDHSAEVRGMDGKRLQQFLIAHNGKIVFTHSQAGAEFASEYLRLDKEFWANPREAAAMMIHAEAMRFAMDAGCLTKEDLLKTDTEVMQLLRTCSSSDVQTRLALLNPQFSVQLGDDGMFVPVKCRFVDPQVLVNGQLKRVSEIEPQFAKKLREHEQWCVLGHHVRLR